MPLPKPTWPTTRRVMGYEAYFYEPAAGGHGYGKDNAERAAFTALGYNFLRRAIGWTL
jgi:prolyl oligopeptidase